jgi:transposase-like protein
LLPSQLFTWRRQAREGRLSGDENTVAFAQAMIAHSPPSAAPSASRMEIVPYGS